MNAEQLYLKQHTLQGAMESEPEPEYDSMEEAEAKWEAENDR